MTLFRFKVAKTKTGHPVHCERKDLLSQPTRRNVVRSMNSEYELRLKNLDSLNSVPSYWLWGQGC